MFPMVFFGSTTLLPWFSHLRARARDAAGAALGSGEGAAPGLSKAAAVQTTGWELVLLLCHGFLDEDG